MLGFTLILLTYALIISAFITVAIVIETIIIFLNLTTSLIFWGVFVGALLLLPHVAYLVITVFILIDRYDRGFSKYIIIAVS